MTRDSTYHESLRAGRLGLVAALAATAGCTGPTPARRAVGEDEMTTVRGGVSADITYPGANSTQSYDNLRFTADITSGAGGSATIGVFAGATKVGYQDVALPGTWDARTQWPLPGVHTARFKFLYDGDWLDAEGDAVRNNVGVHPSVNVYGIRARNLDAGANSTNVSSLYMSERVDSLAAAAPTSTSNTIDGVFGQCGGTDRTQWRLIDTVKIASSEACSDLDALTAACGEPFLCSKGNWSACPALLDCLNTVYFPEASKTNDVYVFHVEDVMCGAHGVSIQFQPPAGTKRTMVLIEAGLAGNPTNYTKTLAHELGHEFSFGHCDDTDPGTVKCDPDDCTSGNSSENLMCSSGPGRSLTPLQCTGYAAGLRWTDIND